MSFYLNLQIPQLVFYCFFKMSAPYYYAACYLYSITVSHDGLSDKYFSQKLHSLFRLKKAKKENLFISISLCVLLSTFQAKFI